MLTELLVPTYRQMLHTLAALIDKAQGQLPDDEAEALLTARLAPDMYPLSSQVRFAVFLAQEAIVRLRGESVPARLDVIASEGRNAGEVPGSIADARARIKEALSFLDGVDASTLDAAADRPLTLALPNGMAFDMTGEQYARDWALPQFYFHVVTAYAILRHRGIEIGKPDYVPHMFVYLRPGSMPGS